MKSLKKIEKLNADPDTIVVYQDEVHFMAESTITRKWAPKGSEPKVKSFPGHKSVAYSGFVIPETGELFVTKPSWFNYETCIASLREFISHVSVPAGKKLCICLDNAPWHKKMVRLINTDPAYQDLKDKVTLLSLPPYSPDLNPIEQVWRCTRREITHNRFWATLAYLVDLDAWFASLSKPNDKLSSLCSFQYA